jgi:pilus assembly protein CpaB
MKGARALIMLVLALVAGVGAVVLASRWLNEHNASTTTQVAVAARDLNLGTALETNQITLVSWPAHAVPKGAFRDKASLQGRVTSTGLQAGEPVLEARLAPIGTKGGLSALISEGKRAITVRVNEVVGVAGFALPGNYVDVMVNTDDEGRPISKIVLERILVLAVAQEVGRDETKPRVVNAVTLEVAPEQAEKVDLARSVGNLSLVLRNQIDPNSSATEGVTKRQLLGRPDPVAIQPPAPPEVQAPAPVAAAPAPAPAPRPVPVARKPQPEPERVEVIRGVHRSEARF